MNASLRWLAAPDDRAGAGRALDRNVIPSAWPDRAPLVDAGAGDETQRLTVSSLSRAVWHGASHLNAMAALRGFHWAALKKGCAGVLAELAPALLWLWQTVRRVSANRIKEPSL